MNCLLAKNSHFRASFVVVISLVGLFVVSILVYVPLPFTTPPLLRASSEPNSRGALPPYVAFVDAGSTGSRLHVFEIAARTSFAPAFNLRAAAAKRKWDVPLASLARKSKPEVR